MLVLFLGHNITLIELVHDQLLARVERAVASVGFQTWNEDVLLDIEGPSMRPLGQRGSVDVLGN